MINIKYFLQFIIIVFLFLIFKILGVRFSSFLGGKLFQIIGPAFRSKEIINNNIKRAFPDLNSKEINKINSSMWNNYGRVFAEYIYMKNFRHGNLSKNISIEGEDILANIKKQNQKVIFISGHFSNFELMAMQIDKLDLKIGAIYRPLNNIFLNKIMERIRKKYICNNQIKKGIGGLKELIKLNNEGYSTALMIDQRVSQGIKSNFFNEEAFTTTVPAQLVKKFNIPVVPIFIERYEGIKFKMKIFKPVHFSVEDSIENITADLNKILEKMILDNPNNWIWSHNRWK
ncbi:MAG: lysophospholipid acyltransferase family protein [Candidatus Pelagibacter sp.]